MFRSTTILGLRKNGITVMGGDGQVTFGETIVKKGAKKVKRLYDGKVLAGFAGSVADALTLFDKFERYLINAKGDIIKASTDLTKEWRQDKILRQLEAMLVVMDEEHSLIISGKGDIVEPDDGIVSIGSGSSYAYAASRALMRYSNLSAEEIVINSLKIVSDICIYTNDNLTIEILK